MGMDTKTRQKRDRSKYRKNITTESGMVMFAGDSRRGVEDDAVVLERMVGAKPRGMRWEYTQMGFPDAWIAEIVWDRMKVDDGAAMAWLRKAERKAFP